MFHILLAGQCHNSEILPDGGCGLEVSPYSDFRVSEPHFLPHA
jgi:hypothetical protein